MSRFQICLAGILASGVIVTLQPHNTIPYYVGCFGLGWFGFLVSFGRAK